MLRCARRLFVSLTPFALASGAGATPLGSDYADIAAGPNGVAPPGDRAMIPAEAPRSPPPVSLDDGAAFPSLGSEADVREIWRELPERERHELSPGRAPVEATPREP